MLTQGAAIEVCKKQILEAAEKSDRRKELVSRLINLRIRLQDIKDKQERPGEQRGLFLGIDPQPLSCLALQC